VQFAGVTADRYGTLDFGRAGSSEDDVIAEPDDSVAR
jgi:predicted porin